MNFENQNGLKTDGIAGPQVWAALLADVQSGKGDANSWNYVLVNKALPETTTVYQNGAPVYSTPANTGVAAAPDGRRDVPRLRPLHRHDDDRHQPRWLALL